MVAEAATKAAGTGAKTLAWGFNQLANPKHWGRNAKYIMFGLLAVPTLGAATTAVPGAKMAAAFKAAAETTVGAGVNAYENAPEAAQTVWHMLKESFGFVKGLPWGEMVSSAKASLAAGPS